MLDTVQDGHQQAGSLHRLGGWVVWIAPDRRAKPMKAAHVITLDDPASVAATIATAAIATAAAGALTS